VCRFSSLAQNEEWLAENFDKTIHTPEGQIDSAALAGSLDSRGLARGRPASTFMAIAAGGRVLRNFCCGYQRLPQPPARPPRRARSL
jgi:hypothetical protein